MARNRWGKGPFGLRITPDDIRTCFAFLRRAAALVARGLPGAELGPRPARRYVAGPALRGFGVRPSALALKGSEVPPPGFRRRP